MASPITKLRFQVAVHMQLVNGELNGLIAEKILWLYFPFVSCKVARGHAHSSWGKSPAPGNS